MDFRTAVTKQLQATAAALAKTDTASHEAAAALDAQRTPEAPPAPETTATKGET